MNKEIQVRESYMPDVDVAEMCHEANKFYCDYLGDYSQREWKNSPEWLKKSIIQGVVLYRNNPDTTPSESHESWLAEKARTGWVYGKVKDVDKKTHPCIMPYFELPREGQLKDVLFKAICNAFSVPTDDSG